jgi:hypothetical protein
MSPLVLSFPPCYAAISRANHLAAGSWRLPDGLCALARRFVHVPDRTSCLFGGSAPFADGLPRAAPCTVVDSGRTARVTDASSRVSPSFVFKLGRTARRADDSSRAVPYSVFDLGRTVVVTARSSRPLGDSVAGSGDSVLGAPHSVVDLGHFVSVARYRLLAIQVQHGLPHPQLAV